jgi:hypothetical protein
MREAPFFGDHGLDRRATRAPLDPVGLVVGA